MIGAGFSSTYEGLANYQLGQDMLVQRDKTKMRRLGLRRYMIYWMQAPAATVGSTFIGFSRQI
jgi:hypothetical protein